MKIDSKTDRKINKKAHFEQFGFKQKDINGQA